MAPPTRLFKALTALDGQPYGAYRQIEGRYDYGPFVLWVDHVQADPFATPSRVRVQVPARVAALPADFLGDREGRVAVADFLVRAAYRAIRRLCPGVRGSGRSGLIEIDRPGQQMLARSAVQVRPGGIVEARLRVGLPARGRRILGGVAREMFRTEIPRIVEASFLHAHLDGEALAAHVRCYREQEALRRQLPEKGLVAFLPAGARLPRRSGADDRPLEGEGTVPLEVPPEREVVLTGAGGRSFRGLGIPAGVTLVVGGGCHGKSTLLRAVELGIYNHIPGDGREGVVTIPTAVKVRAEDGRAVTGVDISPFIGTLPGGKDTRFFTTELASGSTSQAAGILEAVAAGAKLLLLDEDTSATNFLIRDRRMQALVPQAREPIRPLVDRVRALHRQHGVSTLLVLGGSGDYLDVADTVLHLDAYVPRDVTARAREVAAALPTGRVNEGGELPDRLCRPRRLLPDTFRVAAGARRHGGVKIRVPDRHRILYGKMAIELDALEQLVDAAQTAALAAGLELARDRFVDGRRTVEEVAVLVARRAAEEGLDALVRRPVGGLAQFRALDLAMVLNRMRTLRVRP